MRWTLLVVTACLVAAPCWVSADVQDFAKHKDIRYGQYDPATGRMMPVDQGLRGDPPMWKAEFWESQHPGTGYLTTGYAYSAGGFIQPGFVFAMDWGDLVDADDPARMVGSFDTGWTTNHTLDPTGATGFVHAAGLVPELRRHHRRSELPGRLLRARLDHGGSRGRRCRASPGGRPAASARGGSCPRAI